MNNSNHRIILHRFQEKQRFWSKLQIFHTPVFIAPAVGVTLGIIIIIIIRAFVRCTMSASELTLRCRTLETVGFKQLQRVLNGTSAVTHKVLQQIQLNGSVKEPNISIYFFFPPITQWCSISDVLFTGGRGVSDFSVLKYY